MQKTPKTKKKSKPLKVVNPKGVMTRAEVAMYVGVGVQYLCNLAKAGKFAGDVVSMFGTETFYTKKCVDKWRKSVRTYGNQKKVKLCPTCKVKCSDEV